MASGQYVTYEKQRQRYVFQIRVPVDLRRAFGERTTIRVALGKIPHAEALDRGAALAQAWLAKFQRARRAPAVLIAPDAIVTTLELNDEVVPRTVATWRMLMLPALHKTLAELRGAPDNAWDEAIEVAERELATAQRRLARGQTSDAEDGLTSIESTYRVHFKRLPFQTDQFAEAWNHDAIIIKKTWLAVLRGEASLDELPLPTHAMLPLTRCFGTRADRLATRWSERLALIGATHRKKTMNKYQSISNDLQCVLGERPIDLLRLTDVMALARLWRTRENVAVTIAQKLTILTSLLRPICAAAAEVCSSAIPRTHLGKVRRRPFTAEQLQRLRATFESHERVHADDLHLFDLMILTGARVGEVLQLTGDKLTRTIDGWIIAIRPDDDMSLKNTASERELPIVTIDLPDLDRWLEERVSVGGRLFSGARRDQYGHYGAAESKRLNRILRRQFADTRLVLQSIRNTTGQTLRRAAVDPRVRRRFLGHSDMDVHDKYYDPAELLTAEDLQAAAPVLAELSRRVRMQSDPCSGP